MTFFPPSLSLFLASQNRETDRMKRGSAAVVRVWIQTDLPLKPSGLSLHVTSSKRPSLTTLSLFYSLSSIYHCLSYLVIDLFGLLSPLLGRQL